MTLDEAVAHSAARLRQLAGGELPPVALLLGSGWGAATARLEGAVRVGYDELPAFPRPGIAGHAGQVWIGTWPGAPGGAGQRVLLLAGRKHAYEDGDASAMKGVVRTLATLGVRVLLQTNAAGSLDPALPPGQVMLVADHLNLVQRSPLFGETGSARFVDMGAAYDPALRERARRAAASAGLSLEEGVYAWVMGPQFETPAEIRMLRLLGARAVGMSTVPETILARHAGIRVLALAMITNMAAGLEPEPLSHAHTLARALAGEAQAMAVLHAVLGALEDLS